jgi:hypothetical protein
MSYHPQVRHVDPLLSLARDLVNLENVDSLRLDNLLGTPDQKTKQLRAAMLNHEQLIKRMRGILLCTHLEASNALHQALQETIRRANDALIEAGKGGIS